MKKRPLLSVYDYGQGGVWLLVDASSPEQVEAKYPMLVAFSDKPEWMSQEEKAEYMHRCEASGFHWDIDTPPTGWLKQLSESPS